MSFLARSLRLLLILILALNGVGSAAASVQMTEPVPIRTGSGDDRSGQTPDEPCAMHHASDDQDSDASGGAKGDHDRSADCCKSAACRCACMHVNVSIMPAVLNAPTLIARERSVLPVLLGHRTPVLPHLIRPPIV